MPVISSLCYFLCLLFPPSVISSACVRPRMYHLPFRCGLIPEEHFLCSRMLFPIAQKTRPCISFSWPGRIFIIPGKVRNMLLPLVPDLIDKDFWHHLRTASFSESGHRDFSLPLPVTSQTSPKTAWYGDLWPLRPHHIYH